MPYHKTKGSTLKQYISNSFQDKILVSISNAVIDFRDTLISLGYFLAQKVHNNQEVAQKLCGTAEVVYDGFNGGNATMTQYQNEILCYSSASLMITIFNNLIRGVNVLENEDNPDNLSSAEILGEIRIIYCDDADVCSGLS